LILNKPTIHLDVYEIHGTDKLNVWKIFEKHHYLSATLNTSAVCFVAVWEGVLVAFSANLVMPGRIPPLYEGDCRKKYRESRLVVLPDYQGLGIGTSFSECVGEIFLRRNYRYFSRTAHLKMGVHREESTCWRATSTNQVSREKAQKCSKNEAWHNYKLDTKRICFSHEYLGKNKWSIN